MGEASIELFSMRFQRPHFERQSTLRAHAYVKRTAKFHAKTAVAPMTKAMAAPTAVPTTLLLFASAAMQRRM